MLSLPASAYLDPGTGSFILQAIIAGLMATLFTIKLYWYRLKSFVLRLAGKNVDSDEHKDQEQRPFEEPEKD